MPKSQVVNTNPLTCDATTNPQQIIMEVELTRFKENVQSQEKLQILEERLRVVKSGIGEGAELCLVADVVIPSKFKVPEFDKYKGTSCPKSHLTMYYRKMASHARDDKLLIHFFQDSLTGVALNWYMHLAFAVGKIWLMPSLGNTNIILTWH